MFAESKVQYSVKHTLSRNIYFKYLIKSVIRRSLKSTLRYESYTVLHYNLYIFSIMIQL